MKRKLKLFVSLLMMGLIITGCSQTPITYDESDEPLLLPLSSPHLSILQLTDLHLTYGIDHNDRKTLQLIDGLVEKTNPDLIVITGDMVMSTFGPLLFRQFIRHMDGYGIPWTFTFGNHESDLNPYSSYLNAIDSSSHLLYQVGPELEDGGYGNFIIEATYLDQPFYHLYMMDSKNEDGSAVYDYDSLSSEQIDWYESHAASDATDNISSLVFMHIPLFQYNEYTNYPLIDGAMNEDRVYSQGVDTGMFQAMVDQGVSKGIFVGHDHRSDFSFLYQGVLIAYGRVTGYNAYGDVRGGRLITIDESGVLTSSIISEEEVFGV